MKSTFVLGSGWMIAGAIVIGCGGGDANLPPVGTSSSSSSGSGGEAGSAGMGGSGGGVAGAGGMGTSSSSSSSSGSSANCGDGIVDYMLGEQCDDGNKAGGDGCSAACQIEAAATCGNGVLDLVSGEECDDGNKVAGDGCGPACQLESVGQACGDGMSTAPEVCDDGNSKNGDGCNPTCNSKETSTLFVGTPGMGGAIDGIGTAARISGSGVMTIDATGIWLGDGPARTIRRIDIATKTVTTIAGNPMAGGGYLDSPTGALARFASIEALATDGSTVWIADGANHYIRAMSTTAPYAVTTVAGTGVAGMAMDGIGAAAQFDGLRALTYYKGKVYFLDPTAAIVRTLDPVTKEVKTVAGSPYQMGATDGVGPAARFQSPRYIANDGSGMLYIADTNGNTIRAFNTVTNEVTTFAGDATCGYADGVGTAAKVHRPRGMTSDGTSIYWTEFNAHTIRQGVLATKQVGTMVGTPLPCAINCSCGMNAAGSYMEGTGSAAAWNGPFDITFHWPSNSFFVVDGGNFVIRRIQ
jgi:cysteine-rich repeat protein